MIPIYPIDRETVKSFRGGLVLAVLHDGTEHIGVLSRVEGGRLILNERPQRNANDTGALSGTASSQVVGKKRKEAAIPAQPPLEALFTVPSPESVPLPPIVRLKTDSIAHLFLLDW